MNSTSPTSLTPSAVISLLRNHAYLVIAPAVAGLLLAGFSSLVSPRKWSASQGLIVRSEAAGYADQRLGKFTDLSEMKTVQETLLELARSQRVITAVLEEVGPNRSWTLGAWPTREAVDQLRKHLTITPPGGAEFGNTEVFYVQVSGSSPERAERLVSSLTNQLELRLQELRNERADSMVNELQRGLDTASNSLLAETERLSIFEAEMGSLLGELRNLVSPNGSQSTLDQQVAAIEQDLRQLDMKRRASEQLITMLNTPGDHTERLLATPSTLLESHPTLQRLKDGLVNAQIRHARLLGTRSQDHPLVKASEVTQLKLREEINLQAPEAVDAAEMELAVYESRVESLKSKLATLRETQSGLAKKRAEYSLLLANAEDQARVVEVARKQLADAKATRAGAAGGSVLARIDNAEADLYPGGPGRATVTMAGGLAGLLAGVGGVFVFFGPKPTDPNGPAGEADSIFSGDDDFDTNRSAGESRDSHVILKTTYPLKAADQRAS